MTEETKSGIPMAFLAGLVVMGLLVGGVFLLTRGSKSSGPVVEKPLPLGAVEQTYANQIHFSDLKMSRAANFLNQEVTFLFGSVLNDGPRALHEIEVTIEFHDLFNQVVLRDTRRVFGARSAPLAPGRRREFQFGFEHVPQDWNQQYPSIRVTGLLFE